MSTQLPSCRTRFVRLLGQSLADSCEIGPGAVLVAAVSGGADSLAMLAGLAALARRPHLRYEIVVVHVHHHLRSEADDEAALVESVAEGLGLPFERVDIDGGKMRSGGNLTGRLREQRYRALARIVRERGAEAVVTGHHGTDQVETVLMAMLRGAGLDGLSGMRWRSALYGVPIVRPMLNQSHADCVALCRSIGWVWCEDRSNRMVEESDRAKIRHEVVPKLIEMSPDFERRVCRMTDLAASVDDLVECESRTVFGDVADGERKVARDRSALRLVHPVVLGAALRGVAISLGARADRLSNRVVMTAVDAILDDDRHPRTFEWSGGVRVFVTSRQVRVEVLDG